MLNRFKKPEDSNKYEWTRHVVGKMRHYGISAGVVKRVIRAPHRVEKGIAEGTIAVMQPRSVQERKQRTPTKWRQEIWVMYKEISQKSKVESQKGIDKADIGGKKKIISAWRYPGMSPVGEKIPIPDDIVAELEGVEW